MKHVIQQMKEDRCRCKDSVFNNIIRFYSSAGLINEAVELFNQIPQFNCVNWTGSFNTLLQMVVQKGDLETAYRLYVENSNRWEVNAQVQSFNMLISALCKVKRSDLAVEVFEEMTRQCCFPDRDTYKILMKGLCEEGKLEVATHLLYSMFWRISRKGSGADIVVYRILLKTLCDHREIEVANDILNKVLRKGLKAPKSYYRKLDIAGAFAEGRSLEEIKGLINVALVKCGVPSVASYSAMIVDFYSEGKIADGDNLFDEMRQRGFTASPTLYEAKIKALCGDGRVDEAADVLEKEMVEGNCVPTANIYKILIEYLCKNGKSREAVSFLDMAKRRGHVADKAIYGTLVKGLCNQGPRPCCYTLSSCYVVRRIRSVPLPSIEVEVAPDYDGPKSFGVGLKQHDIRKRH
ncbi:hypothetical protein H6P81_007470 [Aristolochia fimbriata]|uniref:Pentatricopeptide repeat-containing protein n=1 Tax=Aristolochia fimbriata TaxID=158543 RepID=A0AAV7F1I9_ARIFI|nr:hypothetical protein H6P81_007470 [Aristolochia fimbriata]